MGAARDPARGPSLAAQPASGSGQTGDNAEAADKAMASARRFMQMAEQDGRHPAVRPAPPTVLAPVAGRRGPGMAGGSLHPGGSWRFKGMPVPRNVTLNVSQSLLTATKVVLSRRQEKLRRPAQKRHIHCQLPFKPIFCTESGASQHISNIRYRPAGAASESPLLRVAG